MDQVASLESLNQFVVKTFHVLVNGMDHPRPMIHGDKYVFNDHGSTRLEFVYGRLDEQDLMIEQMRRVFDQYVERSVLLQHLVEHVLLSNVDVVDFYLGSVAQRLQRFVKVPRIAVKPNDGRRREEVVPHAKTASVQDSDLAYFEFVFPSTLEQIVVEYGIRMRMAFLSYGGLVRIVLVCDDTEVGHAVEIIDLDKLHVIYQDDACL